MIKFLTKYIKSSLIKSLFLKMPMVSSVIYKLLLKKEFIINNTCHMPTFSKFSADFKFDKNNSENIIVFNKKRYLLDSIILKNIFNNLYSNLNFIK